jgi:3-oxoacyl-[acyl-carrier-protein] synthase-3
MDLARDRIAASPRNVLVVGAEVLMRILSWEDRATSVLFGDGAGAVVMGPGPGRAEVLGAVTGTDGSMTGILTIATGGTRHPFDLEAARTGAHRHLEMNGREVFRQAVAHMSEAVCQVLECSGLDLDDISVLIPHQANKRIIDAVGQRLGISGERVYVNVDRMGNTGSASVPIALSEAVATGRIRPGDLVILTAFGAGFHWGAAAIRFSG